MNPAFSTIKTCAAAISSRSSKWLFLWLWRPQKGVVTYLLPLWLREDISPLRCWWKAFILQLLGLARFLFMYFILYDVSRYSLTHSVLSVLSEWSMSGFSAVCSGLCLLTHGESLFPFSAPWCAATIQNLCLCSFTAVRSICSQPLLPHEKC